MTIAKIILGIVLIVIYLISAFSVVDPLTDRTLKYNNLDFIALLILLTPIVNTVFALIWTDWSSVKEFFKNKSTDC